MSQPEHRITFHLDRRINRALLMARADDGVPAAERIRAALDLWSHGDVQIREQIDLVARGLLEHPATPVPTADSVKLTLALSADRAKDLTRGRADDQIPVATRIRAALTLWESDQQIRRRIDQAASELRRARMAARSSKIGADDRS